MVLGHKYKLNGISGSFIVSWFIIMCSEVNVVENVRAVIVSNHSLFTRGAISPF